MTDIYDEPEIIIIEEEISETSSSDFEDNKIVVYNDDFNTFEWVIDCFCKVLKHTPEQAEQCAILIDGKGSCIVKEGTFDKLRPYAESLIEKNIDARIE